MRNNFLNFPEFYIPKVFEEISSDRILATEFIKGHSLQFVIDNYPQDLKN